MFQPLSVLYGCVMMHNPVKLKTGISLEDVELLPGKLCNLIKNTYGNSQGGQGYKFAGFVSDQGSVACDQKTKDHIFIVTYWKFFDQHEKSHADKLFKQKFPVSAEQTCETGCEMLWQGEPEKELANAG